MKTSTLIVLSVVALSAGAAEPINWKPCEKEVKEYKCSGDDKSVWACLEKHDDKLSAVCQKAHETADKLFKK